MNPQTSKLPARTPPVDRDPAQRPGVPMIPDEVAPVAPPLVTRQVPEIPVLVSVDVGELTPVFSTAVPPRGLSGLMRRRAYGIPEHKARRWMLLLLADRVDVWEGRMLRNPGVTAGVLVAAFAAMAVAGRRR